MVEKKVGNDEWLFNRQVEMTAAGRGPEVEEKEIKKRATGEKKHMQNET